MAEGAAVIRRKPPVDHPSSIVPVRPGGEDRYWAVKINSASTRLLTYTHPLRVVCGAPKEVQGPPRVT